MLLVALEPLGSVLLCVHGWETQRDKIKMPSLSVCCCKSVGSPELPLSSGTLNSDNPVAHCSEAAKSWSVYLGQLVLESSVLWFLTSQLGLV